MRKIGKQRCTCGHPSCKDWWLTGIGKFVQSSGFTEQEADRIILALQPEPGGFYWFTPTEGEEFIEHRDALYDLVQLKAEMEAIGGGPGWRDRMKAAWDRANELFEP